MCVCVFCVSEVGSCVNFILQSTTNQISLLCLAHKRYTRGGEGRGGGVGGWGGGGGGGGGVEEEQRRETNIFHDMVFFLQLSGLADGCGKFKILSET